MANGAVFVTTHNFTDSENPVITYTPPATADWIEAAIISSDGNVLAEYRRIPTNKGTYTFHLTYEERQAFRNACGSTKSVFFTYHLRTRVGDKTYVASSPQRMYSYDKNKPILFGHVDDVSSSGIIALVGSSGNFIKGYSDAQARMVVYPQNGASMAEDFFIIRNGETSKYDDVAPFTSIESDLFVFIAEDSNGNVATTNVSVSFIDYFEPTCTLKNSIVDGSGNTYVECTGNFFNDSFGAVSNTLSVQFRYKERGGSWSSWQNTTDTTINGNIYVSSADVLGLDYQKTYTFEARATDKLAQGSSKQVAYVSVPVFHWGKNDFVHETDVDIHGNLDVTGNMRLKGSGNYGNKLNFGDGEYAYIEEPEDDVLKIYAKNKIIFDSKSISLGGSTIAKGTWTPTLSSSAISSYSYQYGWYNKIGNIVTVGFYVKATCRSGYNATPISIGGLPFTPVVSASGGGMCSGAYVSAGFNFQCYVAESSGSITTRVQACNNTSAGNLSTSASGCCYRDGGGEITLSGTITFMANS